MKKLLKLSFLLYLFTFTACNSDEGNITPVAIPEFLPTLSELNLFQGNLQDLQPIETVYIYDLQTQLFTDYSEKLRFVSIPQGESMIYNDEGLPIFPDNSIMVKTFYYYNDGRDQSLGKKILETRILIKKNDKWEFGNYIWNDEQTEANLDTSGNGNITSFSYIDSNGITNDLHYEIPNTQACMKCHQIHNENTPIGPKIRNLHIENQLETFMANGILSNMPDINTISKLPVWDDHINYSLSERARAYLDVNCAHCHRDGGYFNINHVDRLDFRYELDFEETDIEMARYFIILRMDREPDEEGFMPETGTTIKHEEGYRLMLEYVDTL